MRRRTGRTTRRGPVLLAAVLLATAAGGCSTGSDPSPSSGVDGLVVPTPSPDPADFVEDVDNPWFVLDDATYADGAGTQVERVVAPGPEVEGVATTAVSIGGVVDLYAQDADGNVWWLGHQDAEGTSWSAGQDGAEAGLAMAADPRRGDGYRRAAVPGTDLRAEVLEADATTVLVESTDGAEVTIERYTHGAGLETIETGTGDVLLARQEEGE